MYKYKQVIEYDELTKCWNFNFPKAYKDVQSQAGFQIIINPGYPTGEIGAIYNPNENQAMENASITFKGYDDVSGWVSRVKFSIPELLNALMKLVPDSSFKAETFILALNDLNLKENE